MVKPKFQMTTQRTSYHIQGKRNSKAEAIVERKNINEKKGYAALQTGNFPLIKDRGTIDCRLIKMSTAKKNTY